jgi:hypothetical protein
MFNGQNIYICCSAYGESVSGMVINFIHNVWYYILLWTCILDRLLSYPCEYMHWILYITLHNTHLKPNCQIHFVASCKVPTEVQSIVCSKPALYNPDCTWLQNPSQLEYTLPSKLSQCFYVHLHVSSQVYLQISFLVQPPCMLLNTAGSIQSCTLLSTLSSIPWNTLTDYPQLAIMYDSE